MEVYQVCVALLALIMLTIYVLYARAKASLFAKLVVFLLCLLASLLFYFGARDIIGRPDPFIDEGKFVVSYVEYHEQSGKIYVYASAKIGNPTFKPHLFVLDAAKINKHDKQDLSKLMGLARRGARVLFEKYKEPYGEDEYHLELDRRYDPSLPPKSDQ